MKASFQTHLERSLRAKESSNARYTILETLLKCC